MSFPAFSRRVRLFALLACLLLFIGGNVRADDNIFPASAKAKPFIDFDGKGFLVNGKRTFLASGGMEYTRVPRPMWRDRLLRIKRGGFNCVELYVFWGYHEPTEGKWNLSGNGDLDAYLKLVRQMGMYAIVRPGPYVCAEWDQGGYPLWLRNKPGVRVRENNAPFIAAVDKYFDKVMPIIAANQIHRGGSVILVQLENEHPQGWGTEVPNGYFRHLKDKAVALGIEVPYFFSGLHHGNDPAGNTPWDSANRTSPWFSTEFWPGWYDLYGPLSPANIRKFDRGTWKIIAYGGNGYNFYMLHGGSNFGYTNNDEDAASYDYGAAIGEAGDLRPIYYRFKRASLFARSFPDILANSTNATSEYAGSATGAGVKVTARKSAAGTLLFLDNNSSAPVQSQIKEADGKLFPSTGPVTIAPGEIMPIVKDAEILPGILIERATRMLGVFRHSANYATIVAYGTSGDPVEIRLSAGSERGKIVVREKAPGAYAPAKAQHISLREGTGTRIRVLILNEETADKTWWLDAPDNTGPVVIGPDYMGDYQDNGDRLPAIPVSPRYRMEMPGTGVNRKSRETPMPDYFGAGVGYSTLPRQVTTVIAPLPPTLKQWATFRADGPAQTGLKPGENWSAPSDTPPQMGSDNDLSPYAWYRATVNAPRAGRYSLRFAGGDWMSVFVNGKMVGTTDNRKNFNKPVARNVAVTLPQGSSTLAIFTAHYGRSKLFNYLGPLDTIDIKGLTGAVTIHPVEEGKPEPVSVPVTGWTWKPEPKGASGADANAATLTAGASDTGWLPAPTGASNDVFDRKRGFAWFRATLPAFAGGIPNLHFTGVDDVATVYLNGKKVGQHEGWDEPFDVALGAAWNANGPNTVAVLVENTDNTGGLTLPVTLTPPPTPGIPVTGWQMRGGVSNTKATDMWATPENEGSTVTIGYAQGAVNGRVAGSPAFYWAEFNLPENYDPNAMGAHPIWRLSTPGMTRGFVTLNGHNLGRYPQRVPVDGIYLPEAWLKPGKNEIILFDEEGASPDKVRIVMEEAASRVVGGVGKN